MSSIRKSKVRPVIDHNCCKGKGHCVEECPEDVFILRKLTKTENKSLSRGMRLFVLVHGGKQAFVVHPENCLACGACIRVCSRGAIKLRKWDN